LQELDLPIETSPEAGRRNDENFRSTWTIS
jgi:hypothetical protein